MDEIMATALGVLTAMDRARAKPKNLMLKKRPAPKANQKTHLFLEMGLPKIPNHLTS
jgi:hypothetical protein